MPGGALSVHVRLARESRDARPGFSLDVAFEVPPGTTVLFGPSGAGKTTTLSVIAGLLRPDEGRVAVGSDVWLDSSHGVDRPPHLRRVAYVFQSLALFPHMTAARNVAYGMRRGLASVERRTRAHELLARLKVEHLAERKPATLSGGEAQRVAIARAFATEPEVALFDEPFSALDPDLRRELVTEVRAFVGDLGIPALHVTHDAAVARALADRVVMLDRGRVARAGAAADRVSPGEAGADGPLHSSSSSPASVSSRQR